MIRKEEFWYKAMDADNIPKREYWLDRYDNACRPRCRRFVRFIRPIDDVLEDNKE